MKEQDNTHEESEDEYFVWSHKDIINFSKNKENEQCQM